MPPDSVHTIDALAHFDESWNCSSRSVAIFLDALAPMPNNAALWK